MRATWPLDFGDAYLHCVRPLESFTRCPIEARFIDTCEDAQSYYAHKLIGDHLIEVRGVPVVVRFNAEETHVYTDTRNPCPPADVVVRAGGRERRCLCRARARLMDLILPTLSNPAKALKARTVSGAQLFGPEQASKQRICIVVAPASAGSNVYYVRTMFGVSPTDYARYLRTEPGVTWPSKPQK